MNTEEKLVPTLKVIEAGTAVVPVVDSQDLFRGGKQLMILHAGQVYTLRQTRDNKLILTK
jgi:hemin uptake protein HemP